MVDPGPTRSSVAFIQVGGHGTRGTHQLICKGLERCRNASNQYQRGRGRFEGDFVGEQVFAW